MRKELGIAQNRPIVLVGLIAFASIIVLLQFLFPDSVSTYEVSADRFFNQWINGINISETWSVLGALPFIFLNLFLIYHINNQFNVISNSYYLPTWLYFLISLNDYRLLHLSAELIGSTMLLISIFAFLLINKRQNKHAMLFWSSFFLASGSLVFPQILLYIPFFFIALSIYNGFTIRNLLNLLFGIASLYFIVFSSCILTDRLTIWHQLFEYNRVFEGIVIPEFTGLFLDFLLIFLSMVGLVFFSLNAGFLKVLQRKHLLVLIVFMVFSTFAYLMDGFNIYLRFLGALPMSFIIGNYLVNTKSRFLPRTLLWFMFIFFMISQALSIFSSLSV